MLFNCVDSKGFYKMLLNCVKTCVSCMLFQSVYVLWICHAPCHCSGIIKSLTVIFQVSVPYKHAVVSTRVFCANIMLHSQKRKCHHFNEIFVTGCTESCRFDNFRCRQWWKLRHFRFSTVGISKPFQFIPSYRIHSQATYWGAEMCSRVVKHQKVLVKCGSNVYIFLTLFLECVWFIHVCDMLFFYSYEALQHYTIARDKSAFHYFADTMCSKLACCDPVFVLWNLEIC